jgi:hypothetical protein
VGYFQKGEAGPEIFAALREGAWQPSAAEHLLGASTYLCGIACDVTDDLATRVLAGYAGTRAPGIACSRRADNTGGCVRFYGRPDQPYTVALFYPDVDAEGWASRHLLNDSVPRLELYRHKADRQLAWCEHNGAVLREQELALRGYLEQVNGMPSLGVQWLRQLVRLYRVFDTDVGMLAEREATIGINLDNLDTVLKELQPLAEDYLLGPGRDRLRMRRKQLEADLKFANHARQQAAATIDRLKFELALDRVAVPEQETSGPPATTIRPRKSGECFTAGHALLVGVGADLPITVHDATALRDLLVDRNRAAYSSAQVELLSESGAGRQAILDALDRLAERVSRSSDTTALVYFSGHGGRIERPGLPPEYFLVPFGFDPAWRQHTAISALEFTNKIEAINASKLVVMLDCCHAGGIPMVKTPGETFVKMPAPPELWSRLQTGSGRVVIASSREEEFSYTGSPYSVFTACLLEALGGQASVDQDGYVRILDALIYLFRHVPQRTSARQHPFVKKVLDLTDNFPLCYAGGGEGLPS